MKKIVYTLLTFCFAATAVYGQEDTTSVDDEFLQLLNETVDKKNELGNEEFSSAGQEDQTAAEVPSIVSVISREEIETYGAKDLSEILRMVPGFELGIDVAGIIGTTFRGVNVHEGKQLLMVNGVMMNELAYGNTNNIGTLPAIAIDHIEIIRGPRSDIYGGFAGLAVINVITKQGDSQLEVTGAAGAVGNKGAYTQGNIYAGAKVNDLQVSINLGYQDQPLSTRTYTDYSSDKLNMTSETFGRRWRNAFITMKYKDITLNYNNTRFAFGGHDGYDHSGGSVGLGIIPVSDTSGATAQLENEMHVVKAEYDHKFTPFFSIRPYVEYSRGNAIASSLIENDVTKNSDGIGQQESDNVILQRITAGTMLGFDLKEYGKLDVGVNYFTDIASNRLRNGNDGLYRGVNTSSSDSLVDKQSTYSVSGIVQYNNQFGKLGLTAGGRYETTTFGDAFAPRLGLTFVDNKFSAKLLYGKAFRIPLPWQQYSTFLYGEIPSVDLDPETSTTYEAEVGYKFSEKVSAKLNTYLIDIQDPILFTGSTYENTGEIKTYGIEAEVFARFDGFGGFANGSYAKPISGTANTYLTSDKDNFLASPPIKINSGLYKDFGPLRIAPSMTFLSKRYGSIADGSTKSYDPLAITNLNITYKDIIKDVLDISLYGGNIFGSKYTLIQPYNGGHAPLPALDRKVILTLTAKI